jgi:hypothetical protein
MMVVEEEVLLASRLSILQLKEALHEGTDAREMPLSRPSVGSQSRNPYLLQKIWLLAEPVSVDLLLMVVGDPDAPLSPQYLK